MPNEHIVSYLGDYLSKPSPTGYAVLLAGAWGSGKTFFIKGFFEDLDQIRCLYVSIHGVSTEDELRRRFVFAAYPLLAGKKARAFGSIARSALGAFGIETNLTAEDLLEYDHFDVIVVDDIERTMLPPESVLGFISQLVEQEGRKVILLGNEEELRSGSSKFKSIKEKTVGFTLTVAPDVDSVLTAIEGRLPSALTEIIQTFKAQIVQLFRVSKMNNLRVLTQVLEEFLPIAEALQADKRLSKSYKQEVLNLFLVMSLAYKTGRIGREDIRTREGNHFTRLFAQEGDKPADDPISLLDSDFKEIDVYSIALDNDYLETKICDGLHNDEFLARTIGDAAARSDPASNPEWRNVWHYMSGDDDSTRSSFPRLKRKFEDREYIEAGEILHIFGLLLEGRKLGLLKWSERRILREGKAYLDDLAEAEQLPIFGEDYLSGFRHGAAHGLGFTNAQNPVFVELSGYFRRRADEAKRSRLVERVRRAAEKLTQDPTVFSNMISSSEIDREAYATPVLGSLNVRDLASRFMACDGRGQQEIMLGLATRYTSNPFPQVLETERPWLKRLRQAIGGKLRGRDRLTKVRIARLMEWSLDEPIQTSTPQGAAQDEN